MKVLVEFYDARGNLVERGYHENREMCEAYAAKFIGTMAFDEETPLGGSVVFTPCDDDDKIEG